MVRLGGHADPFLVLLAPLWMLWPSPLSLAFAQIAVVSLGALPVFWLGRRHLGDDRVAGLPRSRLSRLSVGRDECLRSDPSRDVRDPAVPLLHLVPGHRSPRPVRRLRCSSRCRRASSWGCRSSGWGSGSPSRADAARPERSSPSPASRGRSLPSTSSFPRSLTGTASSSGSTTTSAALRRASSGCCSRPGAVLAALFEGHDLVYLVWLGLPLLFLFVLSPGLALVAIPQLLATGCPTFDP